MPMNATHLTHHWVHSHEEDHDGCTIYRPQSYAFPPARGRAALDLCAGGQWTDHPIAAGDGNQAVPGGRWNLTSGGSIELFLPGQKKPNRVLQIVATTASKLTVREL